VFYELAVRLEVEDHFDGCSLRISFAELVFESVGEPARAIGL